MGMIWYRIINSLRRLKTKPPAFYTKDFYLDTNYEIGEFSYGHPHLLHWGEKANLQIGKFCSIAENVKIYLGGNHRIDWVTTYPFNMVNNQFPDAASITGHPATKGDVVIGNDVWIANDVSILSGVVIGNGAVIAAGAVVTKNIGDYEIWAGNPAKFVRKRFSDEHIDKLLKIRWWDWDTGKINIHIKLICSADIELFIKEVEKVPVS